jgi:lipoate-protein ligase A
MISTELAPTTWRLIKSPSANGAWNMAVDEAILRYIGEHQSPPTLRLYSWSPPCLSLGYAQPFSDIDQRRLKELNWDIVRRLTGGRAILHTDEITYSVISPYGESRLAGGILESYLRLSQALLAAVRNLGVNAHANSEPKSNNIQKGNPICFEVPSNYEIIVDGKKLIGSAQARKKEGILQHGTLPLFGDLTRIVDVLKVNKERDFQEQENHNIVRKRLLARATTLENVLGKQISWDKAASAFIQAFEICLNLSLAESELTPTEEAHAQELVEKKYGHPSWTERT